MPLLFLPAGRTGTIKDIAGGKGVRQKLTRMGFVRGAVVDVVQNDNRGPLMVSIGEGKVAIGQGVAQKILVEEPVD